MRLETMRLGSRSLSGRASDAERKGPTNGCVTRPLVSESNQNLLLYGKWPRCYPSFEGTCILAIEDSLQTKTLTSTWPEIFRQVKIADGAPMLDAQQIPEWVQSLSALEQA